MSNAEKLARTQQFIGPGTLGIYDGIETHGWSLTQFEQQAQTYQAEGIDFAIVKVGEYGNTWYGGEFAAIRSIYLKHGVGCAPYWFGHPNTNTADIAGCSAIARIAGGIILDNEDPFNNQGNALRAAVHGVRVAVPDAVIIVSGFGDPVTATGQSWDFSAIADADAYQPQWYLGYWDPYKNHGWQYAIGWADGQCATEFAHFGLGTDFPIQPAINVEGVRFADLTPLAGFLTNWKTGLAVWEAQDVSGAAAKALEAGMGKHSTASPPPSAPSPSPQPTPQPPMPDPVPTRPSIHGSYTVVPGDSLSSIVYKLRRLGWQGTVQTLYAENERTIGSNPNRIFPRQVLSY